MRLVGRVSYSIFVSRVFVFCSAAFASLIALAEPHELPRVGERDTPRSSSHSLCPPALKRKCVALVLGGGGARGGAHIGVLKAIEELQIPVDMVVGTSIGSFVGGLYASGKSSGEISELFANADWNAGYRDSLSRSEIPVRRKRQQDAFPIHLDIGFDGKEFKVPKGFIQGQSMKVLIDSMLGHYPIFRSFDDLPIPYRAVAADAETGEEVVLDRGDLATAMQISMSLPGILRPIERDGRVLVDGGIANNIPVSVAKALGADVVIAVDIGAPALDKADLNSSFIILKQLSNLLIRINIEHQKSLLDDDDLLLQPDVSDVGLLGFAKAAQAAEAGYSEAHTKLAQHENIMSLSGLAREKKKAPTPPLLDAEIRIDRIHLNNQTGLSSSFLLHRMKIKEGETYTPDELQNAVNRLNGLGTFSKISTTFEKIEGGTQLNIDVQEKEWGPGYLNFKLSFEDDFDTFSHYEIGASHRLTNISENGAELFTTVEFGTTKKIGAELNWPIRKSPYFWHVASHYSTEVIDYNSDNESYGTIEFNEFESGGGIGWNGIDKLELLLSAVRTDSEIEIPALLKTLLPQDKISATRTGARFQINFDSLDHATFPKKGWKLDAQLNRTRDEFEQLEDYSTEVDAELNNVISFDRHSFRSLLRYQSTLNSDDSSLLGSFSLGGFLNLSGTKKSSIFGQHVRFASVVYSYELKKNNFGAIKLPLYLGISAETGNAWGRKDDIEYSDMISSGSVFLGWNSPLGPAYLAYGRSSESDRSVYIYLGKVF